MRRRPTSLSPLTCRLLACALAATSMPLAAQDPAPDVPARGGGGGGPPGTQRELEVRARFDTDGNGRLDAVERAAARAWLRENRPARDRRAGGGPPRAEAPARDDAEPVTGGRVAPDDVPQHADRALFDPDVVRTFFVEFDVADWHAELDAFHRTDVTVPATVTVDGDVLRDVGVQFRGNTSYSMVRGRKKSIDLRFDDVHGRQTWRGLRNLDLLNCHGDASFVRELLHGHVATQFTAAPRVALARVVVNGEDHGVYAAVQQFDQQFVADHFGTDRGVRFKVPANPRGGGGLHFLGDDPAAYHDGYELKSGDPDVAWPALVALCDVLANAPDERLPAILPQHLAIDSALWFLALDNALADADGYFSRASDYLLYRDPSGRFHPIARDNNEVLLGPRGGPGGPGGPGNPAGAPGGGRRGMGGPANAPLDGATRADRPLLQRLLAVPAWRARHLANLRVLTRTVLADDVLAPRLAAWRELLAPLVRADVHAPLGLERFERAFAVDPDGTPAAGSLRALVAQRRDTILHDAAMQGPWPQLEALRTTVATGTAGNDTLHVTVRGTGVATAVLHHTTGAFGPFAALPMHDDGAHGDGAANDGVFGATLPPAPAGATTRYWVEATAAGSGHVACEPPAAGARPATFPAAHGR